MRGVGRPGTGGVAEEHEEVLRLKEGEAGGRSWVLLLGFPEFLVIRRGSVRGKQTSQAATGSNSEQRRVLVMEKQD